MGNAPIAVPSDSRLIFPANTKEGAMSNFRFSAGPWNVHEGADAFGPGHRPSIDLESKVEKFKAIGLSGVQFHDDDAVPDLNGLGEGAIKKKAAEVGAMLKRYGMVPEFVAPRLWMDPHTDDGGYTSNSKEDREFAMWRSFRSIDIARALGCDRIVLWLAREGTLCAESKDPVLANRRLVEAIDRMLDYDGSIRILVEPKPNEPVDRSFCPTLGHVMALSAATKDPKRVGGLLESAHAVLAGLDPANEMAFALSMGKLWSVHLNDQNGMRYDQDKAFGVENLRQAFDQVLLLVRQGYGSKGEFIGLDVKAMRTQKADDCYRHIENSIKIFRALERKARSVDQAAWDTLIAERNYEKLEMSVLELLMNG
jgi:xylose isomerase